MNKIYIFTLLFLVTTLSLFPQQEFIPEQKLIELSGKKENIGITAAYAVNGEVKWSQSAGLSCQDSEIPFSSTTLTRIASIAKNFTAVAVMQLVEKKRLTSAHL